MKSFRQQLIECKKSGNLIVADVSVYGYPIKTAAICVKNKTACSSGVCKKERENKRR